MEIKNEDGRIRVPLKVIVGGIEMASDEWGQFLDVEKMEIVSVCEDRFSGGYDEEEDEKLTEEIDAGCGTRYFRLPDKYEINEYRIMEDFIYGLLEGDMQDSLAAAIRGRGAFRRFRDGIARFGIDRGWYNFLENAYKKIARDWCEGHGFEVIE